MLSTLRAIVQGDHIRWEDDPKSLLPSSQPSHVLVTVLEPVGKETMRAKRLEAARRLRQIGAFAGVSDPVEWQRENRAERELPERK